MWAAPHTRSTGLLCPAVSCPPREVCTGGSSGRRSGGPQWVIAAPGLQGQWAGHDPLTSRGPQAPATPPRAALLAVPCAPPAVPPWALTAPGPQAPSGTLISWSPVSCWDTQPPEDLCYFVLLYPRRLRGWQGEERQSAEQDQGPGPPARPRQRFCSQLREPVRKAREGLKRSFSTTQRSCSRGQGVW